MDIAVVQLNDKQRMAGIKREFERGMKNRKPDTDIENHFKGMSYIGKALWELYQGEAAKRAKAFENKSIVRFMGQYYDCCEKWAKLNNYRFEDIMIKYASLTQDGYLLIQIIPKPGAVKIVDSE